MAGAERSAEDLLGRMAAWRRVPQFDLLAEREYHEREMGGCDGEDDEPLRAYHGGALDEIERELARRRKMAEPRQYAPPRISPEMVAEIKARVPLHEFAQWLLPIDLKRQGRRYVGRCPMHEDHRPSFVIYENDRGFYCFQCGWGGDIFALARGFEHCDFVTAVLRVATYGGLYVPLGIEQKPIFAEERYQGEG